MTTQAQLTVRVRLDDQVPHAETVDPAGVLYVYLQVDNEPERSIGILAPDNDSERTAWHFKTVNPGHGWIHALSASFYAGPEQFLEAVRLYLVE